MARIRRAVLSCYDKRGIVDLARLLREFDVELISTAGTRQTLLDAGVEVESIADFTGFPEMMDGRVKSLHPKVHAGLLGIRENKLHVEQLQAQDFQWIDLVVVNLHPLDTLTRQPGLTTEEALQHIDVGGVAMIRSAAKNFRYVCVVVNPDRYSTIMHELRAHEGAITFPTRYRLAVEAYELVAYYDKAVADFLRSAEPIKE